ncbi:hypothetical protein [Aquincola sp. J276]|uniref:hypothetical protein n=1 Tax=Aquincola sp. J276 TaxID=2898432 RepID=UPI00215124B1|nr:hypothetical protein [Aquincola sp. J276]MCR5867746.1 hypothetical protein [Aquincola sp. J276]
MDSPAPSRRHAAPAHPRLLQQAGRPFTSVAAVQAWVARHGVARLVLACVCGRVRGPAAMAVRLWVREASWARPR